VCGQAGKTFPVSTLHTGFQMLNKVYFKKVTQFYHTEKLTGVEIISTQKVNFTIIT